VSRELYFRAARRFTPELLAEDAGLRFHVRTADRAMGMRTYAAGPPERRTLRAAVEAMRAQADPSWPDGGTLLEVGANIGTTTVVALAEEGFGAAICFEPLPENHDLLLRNLAENGLGERARVFRRVLSDRSGDVEFEVSPTNSGDGRVRVGSANGGGSDAFGESGRATVTVPAVPLDELVGAGEVDLGGVALAWLDVQGHEGHVLRGARTLVGSDVPVVVELWPYGLRRAGGVDALAELVRANYSGIVDLSEPSGPPRSAGEIDDLIAVYGREPDLSTDLLLLT
jgi:FkbM family methyltransferase